MNCTPTHVVAVIPKTEVGAQVVASTATVAPTAAVAPTVTVAPTAAVATASIAPLRTVVKDALHV